MKLKTGSIFDLKISHLVCVDIGAFYYKYLERWWKECYRRKGYQVKPVGVTPAIDVNQSLKTAGEELQPHDTVLEFGNVSRCYLISNKERVMNLTRLVIWEKVIY